MLKQAEGIPSAVTAKIVVEAAQQGDPLARRIMDEVAQALAAGCVTLVNAFNPCRLILGGGVIEGMPELVDKIKEEVRKCALATATEGLEVLPAQLRHDAGVIGIAAFALQLGSAKVGRSAA